MAISALLNLYAVPPTEVSVLLTGDEQMRRLNREFRQIDSTTDVLSFPTADMPHESLGDIAISIPLATAQAKERGVPRDTELAFLAVHGALHLLGFDDRTENQRVDMLRRMNEVARLVGLPEDFTWSSQPHG